jgi:predicted component of type VI protein secretion system
MVQLNILSGKKAGTSWGARRFPVQIGRSADCSLQLDDAGVWDRHLQIDLVRGEGFVVTTHANALLSIGGQPVQRQALRNGDTLVIGAVSLQFWLARTRQSGLGFREVLTWGAIGAISLAQVSLVYWLLMS